MTKPASITSVARSYYYLTKPGIIGGNLITAAAGFLLGARGHIHPILLLAMLAGLALIIASACVFNNYLDRDLDAHMHRTRHRSLVTGTISPATALVYGALLGLAGAAILIAGTNPLTLALALFGLLAYVALYTPGKRRTTAGTIIGSISGATPPVIGYAAATGRLDLAALLLFAILVIWQMPHFYAIAIYRLHDYTVAGLPVLPAVRGTDLTKRHILAYIAVFTLVAPLLAVFGYTNHIYLIAMLALGLTWLTLGFTRLRTATDQAWGRSMFGFSLIVITAWSLLVSLTS